MHASNTEYMELKCGNCMSHFVICRSCYRGHRYCSPECRDRGYAEAKKRARKKYAQTPEARLDHQDRNRLYRLGRKWNRENFVMDKSSMSDSMAVVPKAEKSSPKASCCIVCDRSFSQEEITPHGKRTSECSFDLGDP